MREVKGLSKRPLDNSCTKHIALWHYNERRRSKSTFYQAQKNLCDFIKRYPAHSQALQTSIAAKERLLH